YGRSREAVARSLVLLALRVARAKGAVAEGLAAAYLRLRKLTLEAGTRLARRGVIDRPEDALYLGRSELEDALRGEPGAYAARVRLRREDDQRWAAFDPPRRLEAMTR